MTESSVNTAALPPVLAEIAEVIGLSLALKLVAECGGTEVYLSARPRDGIAVQVIGAAAMAALFARFGAGHIDIPLASAAHRARRNATIRAASAAGVSKQRLARRLQLTTRQVRRICNTPSNQNDLFD